MVNIYKRMLESAVCEALEKKMVFLSGPRQVGKTTFALALLGQRFHASDSSDSSILSTLRVSERPPSLPQLG